VDTRSKGEFPTHFMKHSVSFTTLDILGRSGKWPGHTRNMDISWRLVRTTGRCSFGKNNKYRVLVPVVGPESKNILCIPRPVSLASITQKEITLIYYALVNSVSWAPHELGAILACASSDGKLSVLTFKSERQHLHLLVRSHLTPYITKMMDNGAPTSLTAMQLGVTRSPGLRQPNQAP
jgi:hypothetical protein